MAKRKPGRRYSQAHDKINREKRIKKIRRFLFAAFVVAVVLTAVVFLILRNNTSITLPENAIGSLFSRVQAFFSGITESVRDFTQDWRNYDNLQKSYDDIYLENQKLTLQLNSYEEASIENERLRELLDAKDRYAALDPIYAKVIARDPGTWFDTFSLNRGTSDGVSVGMAVVTGNGLIGRVYEVGLNYAKVLSIIDSRSAVACLVERTRDNGVMRGQVTSTSDSAVCYVYYLPNINNIAPGDILVTSGTDSMYPKGLTIGKITAVSRGSSSEGNYVLMMPTADFQHIEEVLILRTVIETDTDSLPVVATPTPKPIVTPTPTISALGAATPAPTVDPNIFTYPTPTPDPSIKPTEELIQNLPEDDWVG